jgi:hypothetical protein
MTSKQADDAENSEWQVVSNDDHPYSYTGSFPPDESKLQRRVAENPMACLFECAEQVQRTHESFRDELYHGLQYAYAIARHLSMDFGSFKAFYNLAFFKNGKRKFKVVKQQKNALRHVMNYVFNAQSATARKRTGKYAAALSGYMQRGMPAHIVAEQIKADGGIERLYEISLETEAARPKRRRNLSAGLDPDFLIGDEPVHVRGKAAKQPAGDWSIDGFDGDPSEINERAADDSRGDIEGGLVLKRGRDPSGRPTIAIEMEPKMQARLLGLKEGERVVLRIECKGADGEAENWVRLRAKHAFKCPSTRSKLLH